MRSGWEKEQGPRLKILPAIFSPSDLEQKVVWESFVKLSGIVEAGFDSVAGSRIQS